MTNHGGFTCAADVEMQDLLEEAGDEGEGEEEEEAQAGEGEVSESETLACTSCGTDSPGDDGWQPHPDTGERQGAGCCTLSEAVRGDGWFRLICLLFGSSSRVRSPVRCATAVLPTKAFGAWNGALKRTP